MSGIIYVTQNLLNKKIYVGIHTKGRSSYLGSGKYLTRAIEKYGRENFKRIDVDEFNSIEEGCCKERIWIHELNSKVPNGYNLNDGGEGQFNPCQDVRDKMSEHSAMKRPEISAKNGMARKGIPHLSLRGKPSGMKGKHHSEETKSRIGAKLKGRVSPRKGSHASDLTKTKMSKAKIGKKTPHSERAKANISAAKRGRPWSEARRAVQDQKKRNLV